jgi:hypothetical protein
LAEDGVKIFLQLLPLGVFFLGASCHSVKDQGCL